MFVTAFFLLFREMSTYACIKKSIFIESYDDELKFFPLEAGCIDNRILPKGHHSGDHSCKETHVPIPNTPVKLTSADGSAASLRCESRLSPVL